MKFSFYTALFTILLFTGCQSPKTIEPIIESGDTNNSFPYFTYQTENLFPGDGSLLRAEDGVALEDGRIIVVDQANGLRLIEIDGSSRPFGNLAAAGFVHLPPDQVAGPNGIVLEHDKQHILMSDITDGKIYRTNIAAETTALIYDHPYGVNTIYRDKTGALWFSQSAESNGLAEMFQHANLPIPNGAVYRMANLNSPPVKVIDSLYFANGLTMDENENHLFIAETMMDRITAFDVDINSGELKYLGVAANVLTPDNILLDPKGRLIVASPINNQVVLVDFDHHSQHIIFDGSTKENKKVANEWGRRSHLGLERMELLSPALYSPLPGLLTGMFFSTDGKTFYVTNLGNDILKYDWK